MVVGRRRTAEIVVVEGAVAAKICAQVRIARYRRLYNLTERELWYNR